MQLLVANSFIEQGLLHSFPKEIFLTHSSHNFTPLNKIFQWLLNAYIWKVPSLYYGTQGPLRCAVWLESG